MTQDALATLKEETLKVCAGLTAETGMVRDAAITYRGATLTHKATIKEKTGQKRLVKLMANASDQRGRV